MREGPSFLNLENFIKETNTRMDMNKILAAVAEGGMSVDEFVAKLREQEHVNRLKAEEEARLAAEAEKKAQREAETARAHYITEIANKTLAHGLEASDVAWLIREYITQTHPNVNQEALKELLDDEGVDAIVEAAMETMSMFSSKNPLSALLSSLLDVSTAAESKSKPKTIVVKDFSNPDEILKNFVKSLK